MCLWYYSRCQNKSTIFIHEAFSVIIHKIEVLDFIYSIQRSGILYTDLSCITVFGILDVGECDDGCIADAWILVLYIFSRRTDVSKKGSGFRIYFLNKRIADGSGEE